MTASGIATVHLDVRSHFLDGLTPSDYRTILAAATQRRLLANSVITNQGHPADHLFLLTTPVAQTHPERRLERISAIPFLKYICT